MSFTDSVFANNTLLNATSLDIGNAEIVTLHNVTFFNNTIQPYSDDLDDLLSVPSIAFTRSVLGAALTVDTYNVSISQCNFTDNTSQRNGGGALLFAKDTTTVTGSTFVGNQAAYGGALAYHAPGKKLVVQGCEFDGNRASVSGGAISHIYPPRYSSEDEVEVVSIKDSVFKDNKAGMG